MYLFIAALGLCGCQTFSSYSKRGLHSGCGAQASHCSGFSCCRAWALGMGFSSCGSQALGHRLSSCGALACEIFLDQGSNPRLLRCQVDSLPLSHQGSPTYVYY